jgi:hypothetical protein
MSQGKRAGDPLPSVSVLNLSAACGIKADVKAMAATSFGMSDLIGCAGASVAVESAPGECAGNGCVILIYNTIL